MKLWKVYEKTVKSIAQGVAVTNENKPTGNSPVIELPRLSVAETFVAAHPKRVFANAHTYHINSIAVNSDGETFLSADDLRVNLWNFRVSDQSFSKFD